MRAAWDPMKYRTRTFQGVTNADECQRFQSKSKFEADARPELPWADKILRRDGRMVGHNKPLLPSHPAPKLMLRHHRGTRGALGCMSRPYRSNRRDKDPSGDRVCTAGKESPERDRDAECVGASAPRAAGLHRGRRSAGVGVYPRPVLDMRSLLGPIVARAQLGDKRFGFAMKLYTYVRI